MNSSEANYTGFEFTIDGYSGFAIINTDLKKLEDRFAYDHGVFIDIVPVVNEETGLAGEEEYDYLVEIEKKIIEHLEAHTQTVHVGHTTLPGKREIIFYTKSPEQVENFLDVFLPTIQREFEFEIYEDDQWENVEGFYEQI